MTAVLLPKIRAKVLGDQLVERLVALPGLPAVTVYRGEVSTKGRVPQVNGALDPPLASGSHDVVAPYVVVFDGTGSTDLEVGLERCGEQLRWTPQVTVVAGWSPDCAQTLDRVKAWLKDWQPVLPDVSTGLLRYPDGYDPGPVRPDRTVKPARWFVPLQFRLDATT